MISITITVSGRRFRVRPCTRTNRRYSSYPPRGRRIASLLFHKFFRHTELLKQAAELAKSEQDDLRERNRKRLKREFLRQRRIQKKNRCRHRWKTCPVFEFCEPLQNAVDSLLRSAERYSRIATSIQGKESVSFQTVNVKLIESERKVTTTEGLPGRPWFRHQIYAPGFYTGYGVKTIPAVREAIEQKQWKLAEEQIVKVAQVIESRASLIDSASVELARIFQ